MFQFLASPETAEHIVFLHNNKSEKTVRTASNIQYSIGQRHAGAI
jgi:hypothetical protein